MSTKEHLYRPLQNPNGDLMVNAVVRILQPGTTDAVTQTFYQDPDGTNPYSNPYTCASGVVDIYFDAPIVVKIGVTLGGTEVFFDNVTVSGGINSISTITSLAAQAAAAAADAANSATTAASATTSGIAWDTDGVAYLVGPFSGIALDTDGVPYLLG